jgi:hypothetical protein
MRNIITSCLLSAALLASCSRQSDVAPAQTAAPAKQRSIGQQVFLTNFGTLSPEQSPWSVQIDEREAWVARAMPKSTTAFHDAGRVTTLSSSGVGHSGVPNWHPQSGWFACIDGDERVWVYDGQTNLFILETFETNGVTGNVAFDLRTYRRLVPSEIRSRLSPVAQQLLPHE